ncbi:hypothetical protein DKT69_16435 [Micromonospora sicca]|uniref:Uncharacterized protein n=1 Tax=Micromonospora sicca TaxID=2202420 RepID=A0A317DI91_9ACTN|nr:hypothetical protein DKT69_16435 [Micromonospora sp. 4G51]
MVMVRIVRLRLMVRAVATPTRAAPRLPARPGIPVRSTGTVRVSDARMRKMPAVAMIACVMAGRLRASQVGSASAGMRGAAAAVRAAQAASGRAAPRVHFR